MALANLFPLSAYLSSVSKIRILTNAIIAAFSTEECAYGETNAFRQMSSHVPGYGEYLYSYLFRTVGNQFGKQNSFFHKWMLFFQVTNSGLTSSKHTDQNTLASRTLKIQTINTVLRFIRTNFFSLLLCDFFIFLILLFEHT